MRRSGARHNDRNTSRANTQFSVSIDPATISYPIPHPQPEFEHVQTLGYQSGPLDSQSTVSFKEPHQVPTSSSKPSRADSRRQKPSKAVRQDLLPILNHKYSFSRTSTFSSAKDWEPPSKYPDDERSTRGDANGNGTGNQSLYSSQAERTYLPPWALLGPSLAALLLTAGLATAMVVWIQSHKLPLRSEGVIFVREGAEEEPDRLYTDDTLGKDRALRFNTQIAHSIGLSFSTIISTLVGFSVYPLMSLIAYSLAIDWLVLQSQVAESPSMDLQEKLPTPLQYSLLLQICGANTVHAVVDTVRHMLHGKGSRVKVPPMLRKALAWLVTLLLLNTIIGWTDFALHETVKVVQVIHIDETPQAMGFGMQLNTTLCPPRPDSYLPCKVEADTDGVGFNFAEDFDEVVDEGFLVSTGLSDKYTLSTLNQLRVIPREEVDGDGDEDDLLRRELSVDKADEEDTIVFVTSPTVQRTNMFRARTIGTQSQCTLINTKCRSTVHSFDCSNLGYPNISLNANPGMESRIYVDPQDLPSADLSAEEDYMTSSVPVQVFATFQQPSKANFARTGLSEMRQGHVRWAYAVASCNLTFYEIDLSFFNGTYSIRHSAGADGAIVRDLSGPLLVGEDDHAFGASLAPSVGRVDRQDFEKLMAFLLSHGALSLAAGMLEPLAVEVRTFEEVLASQYPKAELYFYFTILYTYAAVAILLFFQAWSTSSDCVTYDDAETGETVRVPAGLLAQTILMDPGHLIAAHFNHNKQSSDKELDRAATLVDGVADNPNLAAMRRTTSTSLLKLFDEPEHEERLVVGLESSGRGFGVWPMSQALGAVGKDYSLNSERGQGLLRARSLFGHRHHTEEQRQ